MRPMYESAQDAENERSVITSAINKMGFTGHRKLPISYGFDFALMRGQEIKAVAEIKCRNKRYDTLFLSLQKVQKGIDYVRNGLLAYLIIQWPDGVYCYRLEDYDARRYPIEFGGRTDRGDSADVEPVVHFPVTAFRKVL